MSGDKIEFDREKATTENPLLDDHVTCARCLRLTQATRTLTIHGRTLCFSCGSVWFEDDDEEES